MKYTKVLPYLLVLGIPGAILMVWSESYKAHPGQVLPELEQARVYFNDIYPGRHFRFVWKDRAFWREGFAIPMDEPRFAPVPFECSVQVPSRCHLRP